MTREELIRNLKYTMEKHKNDTVNTFGTNISIMCKDILDYLEQEPCCDECKYKTFTELYFHTDPEMVEQEPKWIPVNERLPDDRREVLVTAYWHETYQVMMASYFGDGLWWCVPFNNCGEHTQRLKPKAWMPLPEPYEQQEREDKK